MLQPPYRLSRLQITLRYERDFILEAPKTTRGNRSKAATLLKTTDRAINSKVRKYEIDISRFRKRLAEPDEHF